MALIKPIGIFATAPKPPAPEPEPPKPDPIKVEGIPCNPIEVGTFFADHGAPRIK